MKKLFVVWVAILCLTACGSGSSLLGVTPSAVPTITVPPRPGLDPNMVALGEAVYAEHCAECHGLSLEGERDWQDLNEDGSYRAPAQDVTGHTWQHDDTRLIQIIKLGGARVSPDVGVSKMPGYANILSDVEITAVLAYIKSSWPPEVQQVQWEVTVRE